MLSRRFLYVWINGRRAARATGLNYSSVIEPELFVGDLGGLRIVCYHDQRDAQLLVESPEQVENLIGRNGVADVMSTVRYYCLTAIDVALQS